MGGHRETADGGIVAHLTSQEKKKRWRPWRSVALVAVRVVTAELAYINNFGPRIYVALGLLAVAMHHQLTTVSLTTHSINNYNRVTK